MPQPFVVILGKAVRYAAKLRGGGSALPGLFVEKIDPGFAKKILSKLPHGVVVISGSNGKTTTTKVVVELLQSQGLKVFTNKSGSNFVRGVIAALLGEIDSRGNLDADIAVLELDEAHAVHFVKSIPPKYSLILNVMRDQLDRFGEIDNTARLLQKIAEATTDTVVLNREDERIAKIADSLSGQKVAWFGLDDSLKKHFPSDDELHSNKITSKKRPTADVTLVEFTDDSATFKIDNDLHSGKLNLRGAYNMFNAAAAIALTRAIVKESLDEINLFTTLSQITPAFGRGETVEVGGQPIELVLVKNPSGFRLGLQSFQASDWKTMIAINDNYADGRDMSWLWDVDFTSLSKTGVAIVSGIRAYDMALRLKYDEVDFGSVEEDLSAALRRFIDDNPDSPKRIYCTYTAMLTLRRELSKITDVEAIS